MDLFRKLLPINTASAGFTVTELLVTMALVIVMSSLVGISLVRPQNKATLDSSVAKLIADIKYQQQAAITGLTIEMDTPAPHGLKIQPTSYTLFTTSFENTNSHFTVNIEGAELTSSFPNNEVIFAPISGELELYASSSASIQVKDTSSGITKTISVSRYGAIDLL